MTHVVIILENTTGLTGHFDISAAATIYHMPRVTHQHASRGSVLGVISKISDFRVCTVALIGVFEVMNLEIKWKERNFQLPHNLGHERS